MAAIQRPAIAFPGQLGQRRARIWMAAAAVMLVGLALAQVNQFSRVTGTGYEIDHLQQQRAEKLAANHELEAQVAALSSLARVDWEARTRLGMVPAQRRLYVESNLPPPSHQVLPSRFRPEPAREPPAPSSDRPWWRDAIDLLPY
jgi:cell division protein FtsB